MVTQRDQLPPRVVALMRNHDLGRDSVRVAAIKNISMSTVEPIVQSHCMGGAEAFGRSVSRQSLHARGHLRCRATYLLLASGALQRGGGSLGPLARARHHLVATHAGRERGLDTHSWASPSAAKGRGGPRPHVGEGGSVELYACVGKPIRCKRSFRPRRRTSSSSPARCLTLVYAPLEPHTAVPCARRPPRWSRCLPPFLFSRPLSLFRSLACCAAAMAFVFAPPLVTPPRQGSPLWRPPAMATSPPPRGSDGGLPRTAWVAAPATAATAARAAARVGNGTPDGEWRRAAAAAAPMTTALTDQETVDEAALRAADIQEALADLAELRCRIVQGEERLGSPSTVGLGWGWSSRRGCGRTVLGAPESPVVMCFHGFGRLRGCGRMVRPAALLATTDHGLLTLFVPHVCCVLHPDDHRFVDLWARAHEGSPTGGWCRSTPARDGRTGRIARG